MNLKIIILIMALAPLASCEEEKSTKDDFMVAGFEQNTADTDKSNESEEYMIEDGDQDQDSHNDLLNYAKNPIDRAKKAVKETEESNEEKEELIN